MLSQSEAEAAAAIRWQDVGITQPVKAVQQHQVVVGIPLKVGVGAKKRDAGATIRTIHALQITAHGNLLIIIVTKKVVGIITLLVVVQQAVATGLLQDTAQNKIVGTTKTRLHARALRTL
ncbi:hypothetical protein A3K64_01910 [Candidatus Micrarchaeota archaeon RBG_16_36_9]|nr:MAG: hypothetical protein A3K64_01910 [Candidatus Micrarchaeota archaeon RBG_16_36_9]